MTKSIIADNKPVSVTLEKGTEYYFCTCGRSKGQPFCDGSHTGTSFSPKAFIAEKEGEAWLCACKQSGNTPFCDGTHEKYSDEQVGKETA
ncbi:Glutamate synthase [NADPH] large chain [hydrothermal vent metagenome]|uniref:Glutamate synthase [NADPH] large chain n=1 Tax=hydrothermal vent metagenome TaxID=652676 RepID=A0A3B0XDF9_9ZZZZ